MKIFQFLITRSLWLYVFVFCGSLFLIDYSKIHERIVIRTLNDNMPQNFAYFLKIDAAEERFIKNVDLEQLKPFLNYYEKVVYYFPKLAEAHLMLGLNYYYFNEEDEALKALEKAAVLNPHFFWSQYSLGAVLFNQGDYSRAAEIFENARTIRPEIVLKIINQSVVYKRLFSQASNINTLILPRLKTGFSECYRLLVFSLIQEERHAQAIRHSKEAISLGLGQQERFLLYMAISSYYLKHYGSSIQLIKEALELDPNYVQAYQFLALNLKAMGQEAAAQEILSKTALLINSGYQKFPEDDAALLKVF